MTHDELLARLNSAPNSDTCWKIAILRAVVELHKPKKHCVNHICTVLSCVSCNFDNGNGIIYPCPTIKTIEKELELSGGY